ncbi:MAG: glutamate--tRNA ligase [candidate division WS1 bacterium]|jgi:glutamyl-tRNA synthetase|nr:glutamate--tRNA ligase [candidate division WS1 bacterium]
MSEIRTRFAPSPTGNLHVGGAHTALFAWLFARHEGGKFILRIEDTDEVRSTEQSLAAIYDGLRWLEIDWDEGPDISGPFGPYVQSERLNIYAQYINQLIESGRAYRCFCTPEELEERREIMRARGIPPVYDRTCANLSEEQIELLLAEGKPYCVRFRMLETGTTVVNDLIRGDVSFDNSLLGDFVIRKTSGYPTYHMAVVVDDCLMKISHVIRAEEHLANTPSHVQLMDALGFERPKFAHLPLILGTDKTKLSKRHGAVNLMDYKEQGFLPEAMRNFLAIIGWSPGADEEILDHDQLIARFTLEGVSKSPGVFDLEKATWLNGEYLKRADAEKLTDTLLPLLQKEGLIEAHPSPERREWLVAVVDLMKERTRLLTDFVTWGRYYFTEDYPYDNEARKKWLSKEDTPERLDMLADRMKELETWDVEAIEAGIRGLAEELEIGAGKVIHPCRSAVTGQTIGPSLFHLLELLPRETVVARLRRAAELGRRGELAPV